ncbi:hypothetical protein BO85DRAFT_251809 [Aspergillus piperis CBS 112811]|uniref:Secreted protein n=1 Tax=Aspergillus piperis CBS 112811 TaxID=1448313 RepID=A0A8G1R5H0_9EURO|nr:hypothetical protein BO85DRAFT_251809 [Aspergillus piperis CBS 112811]RAH59859.1 hypothetical protein BO85DRAFT_251809 [Aspergillus piperis CBS 112811]
MPCELLVLDLLLLGCTNAQSHSACPTLGCTDFSIRGCLAVVACQRWPQDLSGVQAADGGGLRYCIWHRQKSTDHKYREPHVLFLNADLRLSWNIYTCKSSRLSQIAGAMSQTRRSDYFDLSDTIICVSFYRMCSLRDEHLLLESSMKASHIGATALSTVSGAAKSCAEF